MQHTLLAGGVNSSDIINTYEESNYVTSLLENAKFQFAATMAYAPHMYTLKKTWNEADYMNMVRHLIQGNEDIWYKGNKYRSFLSNGWRYWAMTKDPHLSLLINRCRHYYHSAYDFISEEYDDEYDPSHNKDCAEEDRKLKIHLGEFSGKSVLDIGCGTGWFLDNAQDLMDEKTEWKGIEPSTSMSFQLVQKYPKRMTDLTICPLEHYFPNRKYDRIIALYGVGSMISADTISLIPSMLNSGGRYDIMRYTADKMVNYDQPMMKRFGIGDYFPSGTIEAIDNLQGLDSIVEIGDYHVCYTGTV